MKSTDQGQKTLADQLNDLLRDCKDVLRDRLFFEQEDETAQLVCATERGRFTEGWTISQYEPDALYIVEYAKLIRGVRYTRNGDGWPDDIDIQEHWRGETIIGAFEHLMSFWFGEQIARCLESAAETRMLEQQERGEL